VIGGRRGGALHIAAEDYDRAARRAWGRLPEPSPAGSGLRAASGLLAAARLVRRAETAQMLALLAQLAALADAVGRMRLEQDRAVQAAAARRGGEQLRAEYGRRLAGAAAGQQRLRQALPTVEATRETGWAGATGAASRPVPLEAGGPSRPGPLPAWGRGAAMRAVSCHRAGGQPGGAAVDDLAVDVPGCVDVQVAVVGAQPEAVEAVAGG